MRSCCPAPHCTAVLQKRYFMMHNDWLKGAAEVRLAPGKVPEGGPCTYRVVVTTSDLRGAGTDANVTMQLFGAKGDTGERKLGEQGCCVGCSGLAPRLFCGLLVCRRCMGALRCIASEAGALIPPLASASAMMMHHTHPRPIAPSPCAPRRACPPPPRLLGEQL